MTMVKWLGFAVVAAVGAGLPGCLPPPDPARTPDAAPPDAPPPPPPDAPPPPPDAAPAYTCVDLAPANGDGHHFPGRECTESCHDGVVGPRWHLGGTLYRDFAGARPYAGATITVLDDAGRRIELVTSTNGNFWLDARTYPTVAFPVRTYASACPDVAPMNAAVGAPGNCNGGGCHQDPALYPGRVHLPFPP